MDNLIVMGVDIGGSHITAALIDLETSTILPGSYIRSTVNYGGSAEEIISEWSATMLKTTSNHEVKDLKIGIAIPGPFDYENGISYIKDQDKYDALHGLNIKVLLAEQFGCCSQNILLINDASSFLQGEVFGGVAKGYKHVVGITLGTGLGASRYHGGTAEDANLWCAPFRDSIAEDYLSTRWFVKRYAELSNKSVNNVKELADLYGSDLQAQLVFQEFGQNLGHFLTQVITVDDPEVIVVGGNIGKAIDLFLQPVVQVLEEESHYVPLLQASLGETASLIGAASCWNNVGVKLFNVIN